MAEVIIPQKKDPLDQVLKALSIAREGYGIYSDVSKLGMLKDQREEEKAARDEAKAAKEESAKGVITPREEAQLRREGFTDASGPEIGAVALTRKQDGQRVFLKIPEKQTKADELTAYQKAQLGIQQERLALDKQKLSQDEGKKVQEDKKLARTENEAKYRYNILQRNAAELSKIIDKEGTFAPVGGSGERMDGLIYQMAVDYAKLVDPDSVAREGEVAAAKKYMLPVRNMAGLGMSNATAQKLIRDYLTDLDSRLTARGIDTQGQTAVAGNQRSGLRLPSMAPSAEAAPAQTVTRDEAIMELKRRGKLK